MEEMNEIRRDVKYGSRREGNGRKIRIKRTTKRSKDSRIRKRGEVRRTARQQIQRKQQQQHRVTGL